MDEGKNTGESESSMAQCATSSPSGIKHEKNSKRDVKVMDTDASHATMISILRKLRYLEQFDDYHSSSLKFSTSLNLFDTTSILEHEYEGTKDQDEKKLFFASDMAAMMHLNSYNNSAPVTLYTGGFSQRRGEMGTLVVACPSYLRAERVTGTSGPKYTDKLTLVSQKGYITIKPNPDNPLTMPMKFESTGVTERKTGQESPLRTSASKRADSLRHSTKNCRKRFLTPAATVHLSQVNIDQSMTGRTYDAKYLSKWMSKSNRKNMVRDIIEACHLKGVSIGAAHAEQLRVVYCEARCQAEHCIITESVFAGFNQSGLRGLIALPPHLFEVDQAIQTILGLEQLLISVKTIAAYLGHTRDPIQTKVIGTVIGERNEKIANENLLVNFQCMICCLNSYNLHSNPSCVMAKVVDQHRLITSRDKNIWMDGVSQGKLQSEKRNDLATIELVPSLSIKVVGLPPDCYIRGSFVQNLSPLTCQLASEMYNLIAIISLCNFD